MSTTAREGASSPGWRRPAVAALLVAAAALMAWGLAHGGLGLPSLLTRGAPGPVAGTTLVAAPGPERPTAVPPPSAPQTTITPGDSVLTGGTRGEEGDPGSPGGSGTTPPPPVPPTPPVPPPPPPTRPGPVSDLVDPVARTVTGTLGGVTGGATTPLTDPVDHVVDVLTDTLDALLGGTP